MTNAVFAVLLRKEPGEIRITKGEIGKLQNILSIYTRTELEILMARSLQILLYDLNVTSDRIRKYVQNYKAILMPRFINALNNGNLGDMIITD